MVASKVSTLLKENSDASEGNNQNYSIDAIPSQAVEPMTSLLCVKAQKIPLRVLLLFFGYEDFLRLAKSQGVGEMVIGISVRLRSGI